MMTMLSACFSMKEFPRSLLLFASFHVKDVPRSLPLFLALLLNLREAATQLNLKPSTLRDWVFKRKLPYIKIGPPAASGRRSVRIDKKVVDAIIREGEVPAREPRR
jgi:hypothetical protein